MSAPPAYATASQVSPVARVRILGAISSAATDLLPSTMGGAGGPGRPARARDVQPDVRRHSVARRVPCLGDEPRPHRVGQLAHRPPMTGRTGGAPIPSPERVTTAGDADGRGAIGRRPSHSAASSYIARDQIPSCRVAGWHARRTFPGFHRCSNPWPRSRNPHQLPGN